MLLIRAAIEGAASARKKTLKKYPAQLEKSAFVADALNSSGEQLARSNENRSLT